MKLPNLKKENIYGVPIEEKISIELKKSELESMDKYLEVDDLHGLDRIHALTNNIASLSTNLQDKFDVFIKYKWTFVYIMECPKLRVYKIGISSNIRKRLSTARTFCPYPLDLNCVIVTYDSREVERELHRKYEHKRTNGEWFLLEPIDINSIHKNYSAITEDQASYLFSLPSARDWC